LKFVRDIDAVIARRSGGVQERKLQKRSGMGQKMLRRSGPEEDGETSNTDIEYWLPPPRRVESRRDREMVKKQVDTMAEARRRRYQSLLGAAAPSNDWYLSLRATDAEVWIGGTCGFVHVESSTGTWRH
jgi:hypothetical protein